jgi:hypothetical protein
MPLGIEQNSIAPALIQSGGQALVQGIRQIGQQISGHLTEIQTKRDLAGLGQEIQTLNPQSNEFPMQLTQVLSRHPLAARDERAQIGLSVLGKAHGQWQATQADAAAFGRQMKMQEMRDAAAATRAAATDARRGNEIVNIGGRGIKRGTGEVVVDLPEKPEGPYTLAPGAVRYGPGGQKIAENPKPISASTPEARMLRKDKIAVLMRQDQSVRDEFARLEKRRDALSKERMGLKEEDPNAVYLDNTVKAIESTAEDLKNRRLEIQKAIEAIELSPTVEAAPAGVVEPELGAVPASAAAPSVLPAVGDVAAPAAGANVSRVLVLDPNGKRMNLREDQLEAALKSGWKKG